MSFQNNILICTKCLMTPEIDFQINDEKLYGKCSCENKTISSKDFLEYYNINKIKCVKCNKNYIQNLFFYCSNCREIKCDECIKKYDKKHMFISIEDFNFKCYNHLNKKSEFYCFHCKRNFCSKCNNEHKFHSIIDFSKIKNTNNEIKKKINFYAKNMKTYKIKMNILKIKIEDLINELEKMIKEMKNIYDNFYKKNENYFLIFEKIFLNSKNINDKFNYQKNINLNKLFYFEINPNKIPLNRDIVNRYFAYKNFFEKTKYLFLNKNEDKKSIFEKINIENDNFQGKYLILQNGNLINYKFKNLREYDNELKQIYSLELKKNIEKVLEIEKNVIAILTKNVELLIYKKKKNNYNEIKSFLFNFNDDFHSSCYKNFIFDYNKNYIIEIFKDEYPKIYRLKEKVYGILINANIIFTHKEETNKQCLINFKNNKIKSTFNFNLENYYKFKKINEHKIFCIFRNEKLSLINLNNRQIEITIKTNCDNLKIVNEKYFLTYHHYVYYVFNLITFEIIQIIKYGSFFILTPKFLVIDNDKVFKYKD